MSLLKKFILSISAVFIEIYKYIEIWIIYNLVMNSQMSENEAVFQYAKMYLAQYLSSVRIHITIYRWIQFFSK